MSKVKIIRKLLSVVLILTTQLLAAQPSNDSQIIGVVLTSSGTVELKDAQGNTRAFTRRADIFPGDTVVSSANGSGQLKMIDDARIAIKNDTELTFSEYALESLGATENVVIIKLLSGGFRTISGLVGENADDNYRLESPQGVVIICDAVYDARIIGGVLYASVSDGSIEISNAFGRLGLGLGTDYQYGMSSAAVAPIALLAEPVFLKTIPPQPPSIQIANNAPVTLLRCS